MAACGELEKNPLEIDDDGDGLLSTDEALALFNYMFPFQKLDVNHDGMLTMKEFKQIAAAKLGNAPQYEYWMSADQAQRLAELCVRHGS